MTRARTVGAAPVTDGAGSVLIPFPLFTILRQWPDLLDRIRYTLPMVLPLEVGATTPIVRGMLTAAAERPVPIPLEAWSLLQQWRPLLERARTSNLALTLDEAMGLEHASRMMDELNVVREEAGRAP